MRYEVVAPRLKRAFGKLKECRLVAGGAIKPGGGVYIYVLHH